MLRPVIFHEVDILHETLSPASIDHHGPYRDLGLDPYLCRNLGRGHGYGHGRDQNIVPRGGNLYPSEDPGLSKHGAQKVEEHYFADQWVVAALEQ